MKETFRVETALSQNVSLNYSANESIFTLDLLKHNAVYGDSFTYSCGDDVQRLFRKLLEKAANAGSVEVQPVHGCVPLCYDPWSPSVGRGPTA